jgi:hypothetical protein
MEKAMKVTKERLQEIIKEEVENAKQELASADSKQAMTNKLKEIAKLFPKTQGIDKIEIQLLDKLIMAAIKASNDDNAKRELQLALQKLGVEL